MKCNLKIRRLLPNKCLQGCHEKVLDLALYDLMLQGTSTSPFVVEGVCSVTVIFFGNGLCGQSSNPGLSCVHFTLP